MKFKIPEKLLLILIIGSLGACKKEKTPVTIQSNVWEKKEFFGSTYLYFLPNGNVSQFGKLFYNLHTKYYGHYSLSDAQVEFSASTSDAVTLYNIRISGDTLYLDNGSDINIYTKAISPPDTSNWVKSFSISEKHIVAHNKQYGAIETDGTDLFLRTFSSGNKMYRFSLLDNQIMDSAILLQTGSGLGYVNGGLWINDLSVTPYRFLKYNYAAASVVNNSPNLPNNAISMTGSNGKIWFLSSTMELQTFDPSTNTFESKGNFIYLQYYMMGGPFIDMYVDGNLLYISTLQGILVMDLNTGSFTSTYFKPNTFVVGLTRLNGDLWGSVIELADGSIGLGDATVSVCKITLN